ncbi:hypothetical protein ACOMHN_001179 [Nucella lapillus]
MWEYPTGSLGGHGEDHDYHDGYHYKQWSHANGGPPEHNPFYTSIDSMPEIKPRRKSIPLVSDLEMTHTTTTIPLLGCHA